MTYLPGSSRVSQQIWSWWRQPRGRRHMSESVWILGWAQVSLAHGSPDSNKQRGQYSQRYNVLLPKECFSKRFFSKESNVKILFSNPGIFVKNVENPPRNFVGKTWGTLLFLGWVVPRPPPPECVEPLQGRCLHFPPLEAPWAAGPYQGPLLELSAFRLFSFYQFLSSAGWGIPMQSPLWNDEGHTDGSPLVAMVALMFTLARRRMSPECCEGRIWPLSGSRPQNVSLKDPQGETTS